MMMSLANSWPGGRRHAISQSEHGVWNQKHFPGTRQLCTECDRATGRCEDDSLYWDDLGPLCENCWNERKETSDANTNA